MTDEQQSRKIALFEPRAEVLTARINSLALISENIWWSRHARDRMQERGITIRAAINVLQLGMITGEVKPGENAGEWKVKVVRRTKGTRDIGVVVVVIRNERLFVKTVEWEDLR